MYSYEKKVFNSDGQQSIQHYQQNELLTLTSNH